jgi:hypothetical protein
MTRTPSLLPDEVRRLPLAEKLRRVEKVCPGFLQAVEGIANIHLEDHFRALDARTKALGKPRRTGGAR